MLKAGCSNTTCSIPSQTGQHTATFSPACLTYMLREYKTIESEVFKQWLSGEKKDAEEQKMLSTLRPPPPPQAPQLPECVQQSDPDLSGLCW